LKLLTRTDISNLLLQFFEGTIFRCLTSSSKEAKISTFTVYGSWIYISFLHVCQSVALTIEFVNSSSDHGNVYSIQL
jgi:hypothetical protein